MIEVIRELVQPAQPVVGEPSESRLRQVAVRVGADAEVGDRREELVVQPGRVRQLPVRQEAEDLAAQVAWRPVTEAGVRPLGSTRPAGWPPGGRWRPARRPDAGRSMGQDRVGLVEPSLGPAASGASEPGAQTDPWPEPAIARPEAAPTGRRCGAAPPTDQLSSALGVNGTVTRAPGVNAMRSCSWAAASRAMIDGPRSRGWAGSGVRAARRRAAAARVGSVVGSAGAMPPPVEPAPGSAATPGTAATGLATWSRRGSATGPTARVGDNASSASTTIASNAAEARSIPARRRTVRRKARGGPVSRARSSVTRSSQRVGQARTVRARDPSGPSPEGPGPDGYGGVRWARVRFAGDVRPGGRQRTVSAGRGSSTTGRSPSTPARRTGRRGCHRSWCRASR